MTLLLTPPDLSLPLTLSDMHDALATSINARAIIIIREYYIIYTCGGASHTIPDQDREMYWQKIECAGVPVLNTTLRWALSRHRFTGKVVK